MSDKKPVSIALCGKSPTMASNFKSSLDNGGDFEVTHVCHDLPSALRELPALIRGEKITPDSTIVTTPSTGPPRAVVIGKGFSQDEMDQIVSAGQKAESQVDQEGKKGRITWLLPDDAKFSTGKMAKAALTGGVLLPSVIADRVKEAMNENGVLPGQEGKGGVFGF